ncbi:MAG: histidine kinase, partial [Oceanospirillales bacterium]|nr:histidine kinase [Oceanospirillales bacterium]
MTIDDIDVFWVLLCACLVWIMQAGFLCLETGLTRSKNNINVALKNICDNATSIFLFWLVGFSIAFGVPFTNPLSFADNFYLFQSTENHLNAFFVFQAVFCSTCCTIVSGAAAERLRFIMYPVLVTVIAGLIYPVAVNAGWGGLLIHNGEGYLVSLGFYDFAGSSIVHSTGGWVALALVIVVGPRLGRFGKNGEVRPIQGSNLTLSSLGVLILWFGWMGFNGGSAYNFSSDIGIILSNTLIAGSASLVITLLLITRRGGAPSVEDLLNGALGGLVGITASANCVSSLEAVVIGAGSAFSVLLASRLLLRFRLDDVVGAVPVHLAAGIWGTLAAGLFGDLAIIGSGLSRAGQIQAQLFGIVFIAVWAFGAAYVSIRAINALAPFRVPADDESVGLNISEHGATTELYELIAFMKYQSDTGNLSSKAPSDQFTETGIIGMAYNHVMDTLRLKEAILQQTNSKLEAANEELSAYDHLVAHDLKNPLSAIRSYAAMIDVDGDDHQHRQEYVERIRRSSEDALSIIRE